MQPVFLSAICTYNNHHPPFFPQSRSLLPSHMAIRFRCSPHPTLATMKANGPRARVCKVPSGQVTPTRTPTLLVESPTVNKVFEDQALGIVCYKDEHGEVICQGYDEGPRYTRQAPPVVGCESRGARMGLQIPEFQLPRWARRVEGPAGVVCTNGFAAEEPDAH